MTGRARTAPELASQIADAVPGAIARGITWCENGAAEAGELLGLLPPRTAHVIGVTGSPGAGKSTLVNALVGAYRRSGRSVAVVAVDPSSPVSGGALLGDRARLEVPVGDRGLFFRSLASRGASGGLADATFGATRVLSAAGFQTVIVETVGAGQAEVAIMRVADTIALVLQPGAGDELQAMKAGLMEIADVYVLNKADRPGLADLRAQVAGEIALSAGAADRHGGAAGGHRPGGASDGHRLGRAADGHRPGRAVGGHGGAAGGHGPGGAADRRRPGGARAWTPAIIETVANRGTGAEDLVGALDAHGASVRACLPGSGADRAAAAALAEALRIARARFESALSASVDALDALGGTVDAVGNESALGERLASDAARRLSAPPP